MTEEEAIARVKLSIDRQLNGEIDQVFRPPKIDILVYKNADNVVYVRTDTGDFGILEDGSVVEAVIERKH